LAVWHFLALGSECGIKFSRLVVTSIFNHHFGSNLTVTNDFMVNGIVENLAFLSVNYVIFGISS